MVIVWSCIAWSFKVMCIDVLSYIVMNGHVLSFMVMCGQKWTCTVMNGLWGYIWNFGTRAIIGSVENLGNIWDTGENRENRK